MSFAMNSAAIDSTSETPTTAIMYTIEPAQPAFIWRRLRRRLGCFCGCSGSRSSSKCSGVNCSAPAIPNPAAYAPRFIVVKMIIHNSPLCGSASADPVIQNDFTGKCQHEHNKSGLFHQQPQVVPAGADLKVRNGTARQHFPSVSSVKNTNSRKKSTVSGSRMFQMPNGA